MYWLSWIFSLGLYQNLRQSLALKLRIVGASLAMPGSLRELLRVFLPISNGLAQKYRIPRVN